MADIERKNKAVYFILLTSIFLVCLAIYYLKLPVFLQLELKTYDWRLIYSGGKSAKDDVIIGAIDNKSLEQLGRWPWDRRVFGDIIKKIADSGAKVIAVDVLFPERSKEDAGLIKGLDNGKTVLATAFSFDEETADDPEFKEILGKSAYIFVNENVPHDTPDALGMIRPFNELSGRVRYLGHINMFPDIDGVVRKEFVAIKDKDMYLPSMAVQAYKIFKGINDDDVVLMPGVRLSLKDQNVPLDINSGFLIDYTGGEGFFKRVSLSDIYLDSVDKNALKEKAVLIGATALGIYDLRVTPTSQNMPGIEKHAYVLENLINDRILKKAPGYYTIGLMSSFYLIFLVISRRFKVRGITLLGVLNLLILTAVCFYAFSHFKLWINYIYPALTNFFLFFGILIYKYGVEERSGREIRKIFSSYVSDKIVNELIKNPEMAKLGGLKKDITVLFADARGFTTFSEKHTPEEVVQVLNELLGAMTDVIMSHDGTLDKFVGDEIMAVWNVPLDQKNHEELAVKCAVGMIRKNRELVEKWAKEGNDPLTLGIGINTGEAIAGNMGAEGKKMDYTVIGDTVNLGARIEALTRPLGADILLTEYTYDKVKGALDVLTDIEVQECEPQKVKGKAEAVRVFKVIVK